MPSVALRAADVLRVATFVLATSALLGGCSRPEKPPPPPLPTPDQTEKDVLDSAFHECFAGDCDRAHAHIEGISANSLVRSTDAFRAIQYRFDADRLLRADDEPDLVKRRSAYQAVADSPATNVVLRLAATERIARLGARHLGIAMETSLNAEADAGPAMSASARDVAELERLSRSSDLSDQAHVRAKLEPKVYSGKGSREEVAMLRVACKAQGDATCLHQLDRLIVH